jgi:hypothetical protein
MRLLMRGRTKLAIQFMSLLYHGLVAGCMH